MYDRVDERGVPVSRGIPKAVQIAIIVGILVIFAVGAFTILESGYGHWWPADKAWRIPLGDNGKP